MKINNILLSAAAGAVAVSTASCNGYLDKEVDLTLQADVVFADYDMTRGYCAKAYEYLPDAFAGYNDTQYRLSNDCMTDNAVDYWGVARYHAINADSYDATNHWFAEYYWDNRTAGIRHCNQFLKNAREDVVGNSEKSGDDNRLYDRWMAEVRAIRAILHFDMVCWFGDIPVIGDDENGVPMILEPSTGWPDRIDKSEALKWVISECDAIKDDLPFRYSNETENWGRINGAAVYALKSRACLYLASELYNGSGDPSLWTAAATAAKDFITLNSANSNPYTLYTVKNSNVDPYGELGNCYECFATDPVYNNEFILSRSVWTTLQLEYFNAPCGFTGAISAIGYCNPTQNLVDAFETINGLPIDQDPSYDEQNPYANRDPRLAQTIFYHGMTWGDGDEARQLDMNNDDTRVGADYARGNGGTATGYFCKKYVYNIRWDGTISSQKHACPIFRYAEMLLNAAEALCEAGSSKEALSYVNQLRARGGMPDLSSSLSQSELRERIRNERRIELCFEDHRYFDVRRWKLHETNGSAAAETSKPRYQQVYNLYGVEIREGAEPSAPFVYGASRIDAKVAFTAPKNYFFPIMYDELVRTGYPQTDGW